MILRAPFVNLRLRLLLLVLLAVLPALGLVTYTAGEERRILEANVQSEALRVARLAADKQEQFIEGARQLLFGLAQLPEVRRGDSAACSALFASLLQEYPRYANLGAIRLDGDIFCSALPMNAPVNAADRAFFQRALETRTFAVGDYQVGRITGKATVNFGLPVLDPSGQTQAVVFAALDLAWLNELAADAELPEGAALTVIDRGATVLARYPDAGQWIGRAMPDQPLVATILSQRQGVAEVEGEAVAFVCAGARSA